MAPASKGLGYGMLIISFLVVIYYNMIIAWTLFYTVAGLSAELPWQFCGNTTLTRYVAYLETYIEISKNDIERILNYNDFGALTQF